MVLTREALIALEEGELREKVLIPLFREMGFQDVNHYHGGSQEQGKDIVMWKPDPDAFSPRLNYAVVVKAKKISGQITSRAGASEVLTQIQQCFTKPYADPVTTEERAVDRCFVVSSQEILKEARNAINGILQQNNYHLVTRFIDGDMLWELVKTHLAGQAALAMVQEVQQQFNKADPDWRPFVITKGGNTIVSVEPKHADAPPLPISFVGKFPRTPEGDEQRAALERHLKTGAPFTLESDYFKDFAPPPFMRTFVDPENLGKGTLTITPHRSARTWRVKVAFESNTGDTVEMGYIELQVAQGGTEEVTLDNYHQLVPWRFQFVINTNEKRLRFHYHWDLEGQNVKQVVEAFKFQRAILNGGTFKVLHWDSGLEFIPPRSIIPKPDEPALEERIRLFEEVLFIQEQVGVPISLPNRTLSVDDVDTVQWVLQILKTGRVSAYGDLTLELYREDAEKVLEAFQTTKSLRAGPTQSIERIFDTEIPLGPKTVTCLQPEIPEEDLPQVHNAIETANSEETVTIRFRPSGNSPMEVTYHNWIPPSEGQKE